MTLFRRFVTGFCDGGDQGRNRCVMHDLGPTIREVDVDRGDAGDLAERRGDVFDAPVARHAGDPQGGDHTVTVA